MANVNNKSYKINDTGCAPNLDFGFFGLNTRTGTNSSLYKINGYGGPMARESDEGGGTNRQYLKLDSKKMSRINWYIKDSMMVLNKRSVDKI